MHHDEDKHYDILKNSKLPMLHVDMTEFLNPSSPFYMCAVDMFLNDSSCETYRFIHNDRHKKFDFGITVPMLFTQGPSFSDSEGRDQDYEDDMELAYWQSLNKNKMADLIKTENSIFVHRINNSNKIEKFFEAKNANEALEYVKEQTGEDASTFLIESLEGEAAIIAESNSKIEEYKATIAFLKDQREMLAEADRSLPEIKDADNFILSEIKSWEDKIAEINA